MIIVEHLGVNPRRGNGAAAICLDLYFHGTGVVLPPQLGWGEQSVLTIPSCTDGPSGPLADEALNVSSSVTDLRIRNQVVPIRKDENYYWARKINAFGPTKAQVDEWINAAKDSSLDDDVKKQAIEMYEQMRLQVGVFNLQVWDIVRGLVPENRELLLSTETERRRGVADQLPQLLLIDEWDHPRLMQGELPSMCDSFK